MSSVPEVPLWQAGVRLPSGSSCIGRLSGRSCFKIDLFGQYRWVFVSPVLERPQ